MVKKIVFIVIIVICFTININAALLEPSINPPAMIAINSTFDNLTTSQKTYPMDSIATIHVDNTSRVRPYMMIHINSLLPNAVYKITLQVGNPTSENIYGETGYLNITDYIYAGYADLNKILPDIDTSESMYGIIQNKTTYFDQVKKFNLDNYRMFYDETTKQLSIIWYNQDIQYDTYLFVAFGDNTTPYGLNLGVREYPTLLTKDVYTDQLNDILAKLDKIESSGGTLTRDDILSAIDDALLQHDQQQESELNGAIQEGKEKLEEVLDPYFPDSQKFYLKQTINKIKNDILGYTGTQCVITFPAAHNPMAEDALLWQEQEIDLAAAYRLLPSSIRVIISALIDISVSIAVFMQAMGLIYTLIIKPGSGGVDDG